MDRWMELAVLSVKTHQSVIIFFLNGHSYIWSFLPLPSCLLCVISQHNESSDNGTHSQMVSTQRHWWCRSQLYISNVENFEGQNGFWNKFQDLVTSTQKAQGCVAGMLIALLGSKCTESPLSISECWKGISRSCLMVWQAFLIKHTDAIKWWEHTEHDDRRNTILT